MQAIEFVNGSLTYNKNYSFTPTLKEEALIRVLYAGICSTDLEIIKGYMGFNGIPGHEFVGIVENSPDPSWIGKRVVGSINAACHNCPTCYKAGPEHCDNRTVLGIAGRNGAFADMLSLPLTNLYEVPENVPDKAAVFTEPLAAALRICQQIPLDPGSLTAVVGPGRLGLLIAQVLNIHGCDLVVLGRNSAAKKFTESFGIRYQQTSDFADNSFDLVIEATGNPEGFAQSLRLAKPKSTIILKSTFAADSSMDLTKIVVSELNILGSRCGPFGPALRLLKSGSIQTSAFIEAEYPYCKAIEAFAHAAQPGTKKILLHP